MGIIPGRTWRGYYFRKSISLGARIEAAISAFKMTFGSPPQVILLPDGQSYDDPLLGVIIRSAGHGEPKPHRDELYAGPILPPGY